MKFTKKVWIIFLVGSILFVVIVFLFISRWFGHDNLLTEKSLQTSRELNNAKIIIEQRQKTDQQDLVEKIQKISALDQDFDGLSDDEEKKYGTNPLNSDTDGDGLLDKDEIFLYKTKPLNSDTEGDGYLDGYEVDRGENPLK